MVLGCDGCASTSADAREIQLSFPSLQVLTAEELLAFLETRGVQREAGGTAVVRDVLRLADRNGDGVVDRREWVRAYAAVNELLRDEEGTGGFDLASTGKKKILRSGSSSISDIFQPSSAADSPLCGSAADSCHGSGKATVREFTADLS